MCNHQYLVAHSLSIYRCSGLILTFSPKNPTHSPANVREGERNKIPVTLSLQARNCSEVPAAHL